MKPNAALYALLAGSYAGFGGRVYPVGGVPDKPAMPLATYQRISAVRRAEMVGGAATHGRWRYQVNVYATSQQAADLAASAIMAAIKAHRPAADGLRGLDIEGGPRDIPSEIPGRAGQLAAVSLDIGATVVDQ
jgi:hypothetical protein